jgi:hypothetical protein
MQVADRLTPPGDDDVALVNAGKSTRPLGSTLITIAPDPSPPSTATG